MKLFAMVSAGLLAAAAMVPSVATAQAHHREVRSRTIVNRTVVNRHVVNRGGYRADRHRARTVCRTERRHHRRVRVCRNGRW